MGIFAKIIGLVITAIGAVTLYYGINDPIFGYLWFFLALICMSVGFSLLTAGRQQKERKPAPPTVTEIQCDKCDFKEIRDFQKGDFILKPLESRCPKCDGSMTIQGIYVVRELEEEKDSI